MPAHRHYRSRLALASRGTFIDQDEKNNRSSRPRLRNGRALLLLLGLNTDTIFTAWDRKEEEENKGN